MSNPQTPTSQPSTSVDAPVASAPVGAVSPHPAPDAAVSIRAAGPRDRAAVLALLPRLEAFGLPPNVPSGSVAAGEHRAIDAAFTQMPAGGALAVALLQSPDVGETVAGVLFLETRHDYFTGVPHGHVGVLAVSDTAEGRGVGRALLAYADAWGAAAGFDRLTLSVFHDNARARRLYERAGYHADFVRYRKDLVRQVAGEGGARSHPDAAADS